MLWCILLCYVSQGKGAPVSTPGVAKGPLPSPVARLELAEPVDVEMLAESEAPADSKARTEANTAGETRFDSFSAGAV